MSNKLYTTSIRIAASVLAGNSAYDTVEYNHRTYTRWAALRSSLARVSNSGELSLSPNAAADYISATALVREA